MPLPLRFNRLHAQGTRRNWSSARRTANGGRALLVVSGKNVAGALFSCGDAHAAQGDGEVA
jgi:Acetamidase/Formamidase family